jgi:hypothetical protein
MAIAKIERMIWLDGWLKEGDHLRRGVAEKVVGEDEDEQGEEKKEEEEEEEEEEEKKKNETAISRGGALTEGIGEQLREWLTLSVSEEDIESSQSYMIALRLADEVTREAWHVAWCGCIVISLSLSLCV